MIQILKKITKCHVVGILVVLLLHFS